MRLKELRLYGFKSFPHKTVLALSPGMTALVGPNGCGKSNVLDSIRWVLGEQTLSRLRCGRNEDLVFAGSDRLPEQGYCEVSLTVENEGDFPDLPSEVEIKRRYYRTGESNFWINREECRLKEIEAILRGGAAGGRLYSVFDAARLASIVSGELENLMESSAGVLGFREQRKESERKLELVRRDLTRLDDIINERERIVRGLARQRRRAEVYRDLKTALVSLEGRKLQARYRHLLKDLEEKETGVTKLEADERKLLVTIENSRNLLKKQDEELARLIGVERETRLVLDDLGSKLSQAKTSLSSFKARSQALLENIARIDEEQKQALVRSGEIEREIAEANRQKEDVQQRKEKAAIDLKDAREKLEEEERNLADHRNKVRLAREDAKKLSTALTRLFEERTREHSRGENAKALAEATRLELAKLAERSESLKKDVTSVRETIGGARAKSEESEAKIKEAEERLSATIEEAEKLSKERQDRLEQGSRLAGSAASLREKIEDKPRKLLRERLGSRFVAQMEDFLSYPEKLEAALESVLYDILGFAAARELPALETLELEGQAGMLLAREYSTEEKTRPADSRIKLWLADEVKVKEQAPALVKKRLAGWALVDRKDLVQLMEKYPQISFVTEDGAALRADGVVLLGRPRGVLADRRILRSMESDAKEISETITRLEARLDELRKGREKLEEELASKRKVYLESMANLKASESELEKLEKQETEIVRERDRLRREERTKTEEAESSEGKLAELDNTIKTLEAERDSKEGELSTLDQILSREEDALREKLTGLNELLLALGKEEESERAVLDRITRLSAERKRVEETTSAKQTDEGTLRDEIEKIEKSIEGLTQEVTLLEGKRGESEKILAGIDTASIIDAKKESEENFRAQEKELEDMRAALVRLRTDVLLLGREQKELEPIVSKAHSEEEESAQLSPQDIETQIADAQRRIAELGPVNEYAAIQYDEEKSELDRMKAQHLDVIKAAESLEGIIREINTQARSRYEQTFIAVREEFRRTFTFFFPGGEADLKLENPDDPFNSPIQISARPEGKQLKRLAQLSDGERTMLGISLLFAFYAVRPAPFLFVDELDAPLDDNNVLKLASFLARVKDKIQIFVITHNKRTMEKADTIYGVTMEEPGVSKIISVRLKDVKRQHVAVEEA